jgi:hypothetical protein
MSEPECLIRELRREEGHDTRSGPYTVADAVADYLKELEGRGAKSVYHTHRVAETHVLPTLGTALVGKLTAKKIEDWHRGLATKPALARSKPGRKPNHRKADRSADGIRKRRATANRILTVLKAALNLGGHDDDDEITGTARSLHARRPCCRGDPNEGAGRHGAQMFSMARKPQIFRI